MNYKIADTFGATYYIIYTIEVGDNRFIDVKRCDNGLTYIMQNDDGSNAFDNENNYYDIEVDENAIITYINSIPYDYELYL